MHLYFSPTHLRVLRMKAGYSRPLLAKCTSLAPSTIKSYEQGWSTPSVAALGRLAVALGCTVDALYSGERRVAAS